jgi:uncharacterized surface protein with fasciclin (FAS1) repeats
MITAAAAVLLVCPAAAFAQPAPDAPVASPAAPAASPAPAAEAAAPAIPPSPHVMANGDMAATLKAAPQFTILVKALDAAQLMPVLKSQPNITFFAPTDDAFKALPPSQLSQLMLPANASLLQKVLIYHLINASLDSAKLKGAKGAVKTVENSEVQLDGSGAVIMVNNADVIQADIHVTNGVIHVVDKVLIPSDVALPAAAAAAAPASAAPGA